MEDTPRPWALLGQAVFSTWRAGSRERGTKWLFLCWGCSCGSCDHTPGEVPRLALLIALRFLGSGSIV